MGDIPLPTRLISANIGGVDYPRARAADPSPTRSKDPPFLPTSKSRFKFSKLFKNPSRDRECSTSTDASEGSSRNHRHGFNLLFNVFRIKRSKRGSVAGSVVNGSASGVGDGDGDGRVYEKSACVSDGRVDRSSSSNSKDSSCFSLYEEEFGEEIRASLSRFSLHDEEVCNDNHEASSSAETLEMFHEIEKDESEPSNGSSNHSATSREALRVPFSAFLERPEIGENVGERKENGTAGTDKSMIRRIITTKDLKISQLSSLISPALVSFGKKKAAARKITSSAFQWNQNAWRTNLNAKKYLLQSLAARKRLMSGRSGENLCDKRILMGKRCQVMDFTSPLGAGDENRMTLREWPVIPGDANGIPAMESPPEEVAPVEPSAGGYASG